jgi:uncharacterized protein (TIGR02145 family)
MNKVILILTTICLITISAAGTNGIRHEKDSATAPGVVINGVRWATCNVAACGTFAGKPEETGMFYQWNRKKAWPATGETVEGWNSSTPGGTEWEPASDPSPEGWRVPTLKELESLLDEEKVTSEWITRNGAGGRKFTDKITGNNIFLPVAGYRNGSNSELYGDNFTGHYWCSAKYGDKHAYGIVFHDRLVYREEESFRAHGQSVRPVAK